MIYKKSIRFTKKFNLRLQQNISSTVANSVANSQLLSFQDTRQAILWNQSF